MESFKELILNCKYPVFFTGAGISTDSGIPDFRGPHGFWKTNSPIYYQDFIASEESRIKYWEQSINFKSNFGSFLPNDGHKAISKIITNFTTKSALKKSFHKEKSVAPPNPTT